MSGCEVCRCDICKKGKSNEDILLFGNIPSVLSEITDRLCFEIISKLIIDGYVVDKKILRIVRTMIMVEVIDEIKNVS